MRVAVFILCLFSLLVTSGASGCSKIHTGNVKFAASTRYEVSSSCFSRFVTEHITTSSIISAVGEQEEDDSHDDTAKVPVTTVNNCLLSAWYCSDSCSLHNRDVFRRCQFKLTCKAYIHLRALRI
ncbi:hypothetical protein [Niabella aquatica]